MPNYHSLHKPRSNYLFSLPCPCPFLKCFFFLVLPVTFNACLDQGERKRDKEAEDQPDVDHLGVRRWRELLDLAGEDGCHHQHDGQVNCEAGLKVDWLEEGGGIGGDQQQQGGQGTNSSSWFWPLGLIFIFLASLKMIIFGLFEDDYFWPLCY